MLTGPAAKKSGAVRLQLLSCSPLTGPVATNWKPQQRGDSETLSKGGLAYWACRQKIWSGQIAVATLQLADWACRQKIYSSQ